MKFFGIIALQFVCCLLSGSTVELTATSSKRTYAHGVPPRTAEARASSLSGHCRRHSNTQRQVWVSLCEVSGSWCAQGFVCASKSLFPQSCWKFCNQIPLASKVKFLGGSQWLCPVPRLGNLLWVLELLHKCENFFAIILLQFVGCLLSRSIVGLMATSFKITYATCCASQVCCS